MCESICILMTFTVFYWTFFTYYVCLSVCMSVCVCVWATLPDSNKMMMMMMMITTPQLQHRSHPECSKSNFVLDDYKQIQLSHHCLNSLLPSSRFPYSRYSLRSRAHRFSLPQLNIVLYKNMFVDRCSFQYI